MGAAQVLLQRKFPRIRGFQNTVMQDTDSLKQFTERENLQVVHVNCVNRPLDTVGFIKKLKFCLNKIKTKTINSVMSKQYNKTIVKNYAA